MNFGEPEENFEEKRSLSPVIVNGETSAASHLLIYVLHEIVIYFVDHFLCRKILQLEIFTREWFTFVAVILGIEISPQIEETTTEIGFNFWWAFF